MITSMSSPLEVYNELKGKYDEIYYGKDYSVEMEIKGVPVSVDCRLVKGCGKSPGMKIRMFLPYFMTIRDENGRLCELRGAWKPLKGEIVHSSSSVGWKGEKIIPISDEEISKKVLETVRGMGVRIPSE